MISSNLEWQKYMAFSLNENLDENLISLHLIQVKNKHNKPFAHFKNEEKIFLNAPPPRPKKKKKNIWVGSSSACDYPQQE